MCFVWWCALEQMDSHRHGSAQLHHLISDSAHLHFVSGSLPQPLVGPTLRCKPRLTRASPEPCAEGWKAGMALAFCCLSVLWKFCFVLNVAQMSLMEKTR